ncbi:MAG TPA: type II secretion system F family protein [Dehalococcoidia bacterium]|nr:type II secretion system F family protein [Dehalococcoidia bacterium]
MAEFQYIAYNENRRLVKGTEKAINLEIASRLLASRGFKVLSIKPVSTFLPRWSFFPTLTRIPRKTIILFSRQLALLLDSGTPLVTALSLLRDQSTQKRFKTVIDDMILDLRQGQHLSQAMGKHPDVFPKMYVQSILVGEQSASLETILNQLADYIEREETESKAVKSALRYPTILTIVAIAVLAILVIFVLPTFSDFYRDLGLELPPITQFVFDFTLWFSDYGIYVLLFIVVALLLVYVYGKTPRGKIFVDRLILRLPVIGRVVHLNELSRCCRSIAILHRSGLPISEIISMVTDASNNSIIQQALTQVHQDVLQGERISDSMSKNSLFLPMMIQMTSVGELTGTLDSSLLATARSYETDAADRMGTVIDLIQPVITVVLAVVVGLIASALISALYSMFGQFS